MAVRYNWVFAFIILNFHCVFPQNIINSVKDIFKGDTNPPIIVLLNSDQRTKIINDLVPNDRTKRVINKRTKNDNDINGNSVDNDEGAYLLYHLLRTTQENEDLDDSTTRTFEKTKDMLRSALRSRCNKLDRCERRCVTKIYTCKVTCREEYDTFDICKQPVCGKRCWGKTMPPKWLLK